MIATDDTPLTAAVVTTGEARAETNSGDLFCKLSGTLRSATTARCRRPDR